MANSRNVISIFIASLGLLGLCGGYVVFNTRTYVSPGYDIRVVDGETGQPIQNVSVLHYFPYSGRTFRLERSMDTALWLHTQKSNSEGLIDIPSIEEKGSRRLKPDARYPKMFFFKTGYKVATYIDLVSQDGGFILSMDKVGQENLEGSRKKISYLSSSIRRLYFTSEDYCSIILRSNVENFLSPNLNQDSDLKQKNNTNYRMCPKARKM